MIGANSSNMSVGCAVYFYAPAQGKQNLYGQSHGLPTNLVGEGLGHIGGTAAARHPLGAATVLVPSASANNFAATDQFPGGNVHLAVAELRVGGLRSADAKLDRRGRAWAAACVHACSTADGTHVRGGKEASGGKEVSEQGA